MPPATPKCVTNGREHWPSLDQTLSRTHSSVRHLPCEEKPAASREHNKVCCKAWPRSVAVPRRQIRQASEKTKSNRDYPEVAPGKGSRWLVSSQGCIHIPGWCKCGTREADLLPHTFAVPWARFSAAGRGQQAVLPHGGGGPWILRCCPPGHRAGRSAVSLAAADETAGTCRR